MIRALFGGSFDPVHVGHLAMGRRVLAAGLADVVHVVPAWLSPHKEQAVAAPQHRLAMVRLAFAEADGFVIDEREIASGKSCYTVDTLSDLRAEFPADSWRLVIGGDNLADLPRWRQVPRLQSLAEIVVLARTGQDLGEDAVRAVGLDPQRVLRLPDFDHRVSSSAVRAMLSQGPVTAARLAREGVPAAVAHYIVAHRLYLPDRNGETRVADSD